MTLKISARDFPAPELTPYSAKTSRRCETNDKTNGFSRSDVSICMKWFEVAKLQLGSDHLIQAGCRTGQVGLDK
jgi:hypothetical protein